MATSMLRAGHRVTVWNRQQARGSVARQGVYRGESPDAAVADTAVADTADLLTVLFEPTR